MKKRILILEDDTPTLLLYNKLLYEYDLSIANNIPDAILLIENNKPFDCYIFDIHIRGSKFNGSELISKVNKNKVIIASAIYLTYIAKEHQIIKEVLIHQKPFNVNQLKEQIRKIAYDN